MKNGLTARGPFVVPGLLVVHHELGAAAARAEVDPDVVAVGVGHLQAGVGERLLGRRHAEDDVAVGPADLLEVHPGVRVEVGDLAGDLAVVRLGIPVGDPLEAGDPVDEVAPDGVDLVPDGADEAHAGDGDAAGEVGLAHGLGTPVAGSSVGAAVRPAAVASGSARPPGALGSSRGSVSASGAIRRIRPERTRPGPTSTKRVTPAALMAVDGGDPVDAGRQVVDELGAAGLGGGERRGVGVREQRHGGLARRPRPRGRPACPAAASAMSGEWAATLTGRTTARLAPSPFAAAAAASTAGRTPETTTWPGELRFATPKVPWAAPAATRSSRRSSGRPMIAAIAPGCPSPEACMRRPRSRTRRIPSASEIDAGGDEGGVLAHGMAGGEGRDQRLQSGGGAPLLERRGGRRSRRRGGRAGR